MVSKHNLLISPRLRPKARLIKKKKLGSKQFSVHRNFGFKLRLGLKKIVLRKHLHPTKFRLQNKLRFRKNLGKIIPVNKLWVLKKDEFRLNTTVTTFFPYKVNLSLVISPRCIYLKRKRFKD